MTRAAARSNVGKQVAEPDLLDGNGTTRSVIRAHQVLNATGGANTVDAEEKSPCAPVAGIYTVFHQRACALVPRMVFLDAGKAFPRCPRCQDGVLYRLVSPSRRQRG